MRRFLLTCLVLAFCSTASAQTNSYPQVAPAYVGPTVVQQTPSSVQFAGATVTSSSVGTIATTSYSPTIYSSPNITSTRSLAPTNYSRSTISSQVIPGFAQQKAQQAASGNVRGHLNNQLGGARYEGVGWSNVSPRSAVQNCCYWGTRPVAQIGVSKGNDGCWYACVLYQ